MGASLVSPYLWMVGSALAFATMTSCAHAARDYFEWPIVAIARSGLALLFAAALVVRARARFAVLRPPVLWVRSLAGSVSLLCTFYAVALIPVADFLTLTHLYPVWVAVLSWPLLGTRPGAEVWVAVLCGVAGVLLLHPPEGGGFNSAYLIALLASLTSAISVIGLHRVREVDPRAVVVHFSAVSLVFSLTACAVHGEVAPRVALVGWEGLIGWGLLLGVGFFATIGQVLLTMAFAQGAPAKVSVVGLTQVVFGMLFDIVFFERRFQATTLFGIALVMAPTAWMVLRRAGGAGAGHLVEPAESSSASRSEPEPDDGGAGQVGVDEVAAPEATPAT